MENRNITVSLEEARNWYNGMDNTLKRLALQAYTEEELNEPKTYSEVLDRMKIDDLRINLVIQGNTQKSDIERLFRQLDWEYSEHTKLKIIAEYFNRGWNPTIGTDKYFIGRYLPGSPHYPVVSLGNSWGIFRHCNVFYPGIVYFKMAEDAKKAFEMVTLI